MLPTEKFLKGHLSIVNEWEQAFRLQKIMLDNIISTFVLKTSTFPQTALAK